MPSLDPTPMLCKREIRCRWLSPNDTLESSNTRQGHWPKMSRALGGKDQPLIIPSYKWIFQIPLETHNSSSSTHTCIIHQSWKWKDAIALESIPYGRTHPFILTYDQSEFSEDWGSRTFPYCLHLTENTGETGTSVSWSCSEGQLGENSVSYLVISGEEVWEALHQHKGNLLRVSRTYLDV